MTFPSPKPPLIRSVTRQFKKDLKRLQKQGKDIGKLTAVIDALCARQPLAASHRDHPLQGDWKGWRDCHVEPDWILIYREAGDQLKLGRTGSHADLFE
jgi:mRNA interferase YafQ